jgi:hypothetical protein
VTAGDHQVGLSMRFAKRCLEDYTFEIALERRRGNRQHREERLERYGLALLQQRDDAVETLGAIHGYVRRPTPPRCRP